MSERRGRSFVRYGLLALTILPALWLTALVYCYGVNVPYWDEWDNSVVLHMKYMDGTLRLGDFFSYTNEHRPALPRLIDLIVEILTHGNRRAEMFVQIATAACMVYCIYRLARKTVPNYALPLTAIASWLVFSTVQYENWLWGEQLVLVLPVTLLWFGLALIYSERSYWFKVVAGAVIGLAAVYCFAAGFIIFLILAAVQLIHAREKRVNVLFGMLIWVVAISCTARMYTITTPPNHQPMFLSALWLAPGISAVYILLFFGAPFGSHAPPIFDLLGIGALLIVLSLVVLIRVRREFDRALPWLGALAFGGTMALLTMAGRLQFGIQQAMTSRYATFALLLPIGLMFLWAVTFPQWPRGIQRTVVVIGALLLVAQLYASVITVRDMKNTRMNREAALAELPYINVRDDQESQRILHEIYPDRERLTEVANQYSAHGIIPPMVKP
jgi:hypothetical protein